MLIRREDIEGAWKESEEAEKLRESHGRSLLQKANLGKVVKDLGDCPEGF